MNVDTGQSLYIVMAKIQGEKFPVAVCPDLGTAQRLADGMTREAPGQLSKARHAIAAAIVTPLTFSVDEAGWVDAVGDAAWFGGIRRAINLKGREGL